MSSLSRHRPDRPFPRYAYVPGRHPHPTGDVRGHGYGTKTVAPPPLLPERAWESVEFVYGIDLFQHGYYWEAHEAWESLWHAVGRRGTVADFLKGLIALTAAGVKAREGNRNGVRHHAQRALRLLDAVRERVAEESPARYCGLSLPDLIAHAANLADDPVIDATPSQAGRRVFDFNLEWKPS